jgi:hypothetical protein
MVSLGSTREREGSPEAVRIGRLRGGVSRSEGRYRAPPPARQRHQARGEGRQCRPARDLPGGCRGGDDGVQHDRAAELPREIGQRDAQDVDVRSGEDHAHHDERARGPAQVHPPLARQMEGRPVGHRREGGGDEVEHAGADDEVDQAGAEHVARDEVDPAVEGGLERVPHAGDEGEHDQEPQPGDHPAAALRDDDGHDRQPGPGQAQGAGAQPPERADAEGVVHQSADRDPADQADAEQGDADQRRGHRGREDQDRAEHAAEVAPPPQALPEEPPDAFADARGDERRRDEDEPARGIGDDGGGHRRSGLGGEQAVDRRLGADRRAAEHGGADGERAQERLVQALASLLHISHRTQC